jgi:hypothetical protein
LDIYITPVSKAHREFAEMTFGAVTPLRVSLAHDHTVVAAGPHSALQPQRATHTRLPVHSVTPTSIVDIGFVAGQHATIDEHFTTVSAPDVLLILGKYPNEEHIIPVLCLSNRLFTGGVCSP